MKTFFLMLSFFTRLPVPRVKYTEERYVRGLPMIPFVGIIMGLLLYALSFFHFLFHPPVVAMILLGGYIFITGGLHLDGLADTCDGIFSGRERERMLEIMKDSRIGSFGVLAMLFFFVFYMVMYQYLPYEALILLPMVGKSAPLISAYHADYIRPAGMGKLLVDNVGKREYAIALLLPIIVSLAVPFAVAACGGEVLGAGQRRSEAGSSGGRRRRRRISVGHGAVSVRRDLRTGHGCRRDQSGRCHRGNGLCFPPDRVSEKGFGRHYRRYDGHGLRDFPDGVCVCSVPAE
nr:adenosylcobinamide-GDP ribazoletransferase [Bacilliculturomica massiliensis]